MRRFLPISLVFMVLASFCMAEVKYEKHKGELKCLQIKVNYLEPYFWTTDDPPLAGYYIGLPMKYEVRIKNNSRRTFKHLIITAIQEYYESKTCDRWWYPYPREVTVSKGDPMPGESTKVWKNVTLGPHQEIVLVDDYTAPLATVDGLDQTHLIIKHTNKGRVEAAVIYYEPEAGVYCPPPPENLK